MQLQINHKHLHLNVMLAPTTISCIKNSVFLFCLKKLPSAPLRKDFKGALGNFFTGL